ncbi:hypothetical protein [Tenacibaculum finnmarkense]|uniref:hypothetical protein n=1 Tax=Tenacibaculum finnmarkense TaxID=2781243 RepID=UPI001EFB89F9|nr:hypothetical protein [Tenacibaculum finnmarkense]MCG8749464.1 hypothetical protein [Tenacibaculum finnmarkense]MCG8754306.1 hypothetical protein [Tenacibaculum finnmarkense]MCG8783002.1 hypothetical protein [Tenacibaculum finnmarkense]
MGHTLKYISDFTLGNVFTKENVSFFFTNIRQILEKEKLNSEYPKIQFFSNWLVHPELSRKNTTELILLEMRSTIVEHFNEQTEIAIELSKTINLVKLRVEILEFLEKFDIEKGFLEHQEYWNNMELTLLHLLLDKPVFFDKLPELKPEADVEYNFIGFQLIGFKNTIHYELLSNELKKMNSRILIPLPKL